MEDFSNIIHNDEYFKKCFSNKKKDFCSFSYLVEKQLSQSDNIKLGIGIEHLFRLYIDKYTDLINIKEKNKKNKKEKDHLFKDEKNKIIYYAELKSNLCLDTEKSKTTEKKCLYIQNELKEKYPEYTIKMFLVYNRFIKKSDIPEKIFKKYSIKDNIVGVNDYFSSLNIKFQFNSEEDYKIIVNELVEQMFFCST
jgi:hypothetical protein